VERFGYSHAPIGDMGRSTGVRRGAEERLESMSCIHVEKSTEEYGLGSTSVVSGPGFQCRFPDLRLHCSGRRSSLVWIGFLMSCMYALRVIGLVECNVTIHGLYPPQFYPGRRPTLYNSHTPSLSRRFTTITNDLINFSILRNTDKIHAVLRHLP